MWQSTLARDMVLTVHGRQSHRPVLIYYLKLHDQLPLTHMYAQVVVLKLMMVRYNTYALNFAAMSIFEITQCKGIYKHH